MSKRITAVCVGLTFFLFIVGFGLFNNQVLSKQLNTTSIETTLDNNDLAELTIEINTLNNRRRVSKDVYESEKIKDSMLKLAEKRYEKLSALFEKNPADVLRFTLPEEVLKNLPQEVQEFSEKREEVEGELEVIAECEEADGRTLYYLNTSKERFTLHFTKHPDEELLTGKRIDIKGIRVGNKIAVDETITENQLKDSSITESVLQNTTGELKVLVLLEVIS